jgi:hypothetical protein
VYLAVYLFMEYKNIKDYPENVTECLAATKLNSKIGHIRE